jgi:hypothetical protein
MRLSLLCVGLAAVSGTVLLSGAPAVAGRCGTQNPLHCGLDEQTDPPTLPGGTGGCTEASLAAAPLFQGTGHCKSGETEVIYDLGVPFPDNGHPGDAAVIGATSFATMRAGTTSPCAHMVDTVDPKPCPDPQLCPGDPNDPNAPVPQPEGAIKVGITGYLIGCWSKPSPHHNCRDLRVYTKAVCLHLAHQTLGPGCSKAGSIDCANVSTEQVAVDVPGGSNRRLCPPTDPNMSCRGTRFNTGDPGIRFRLGGFCSTNNCASPGVAPDIDPVNSCDSAWGATNLGYNRPPGRGINQPGWYDWKTGSFKVDLTSPKSTCGPLGECLSQHAGVPWDLRVVAVPRPGQALPCVGDGSSCDPNSCF